ncbi:hypothetical protein [Spiroplasma endosymbiont of Lonchoptera lutea]|uniref:hypothetical protein n=1 Tax=Spiroplasma endosymbiont of Lonchoptera lutea TaxID=3066297 RepID=UPI0030D47085
MIFFNSEHDFNLTELNKGIDVLEVLKKKIMLIDSSIIVDLLYSSYQLKLNTFRDSFWILITYQKKSFSKKLKLINIQTVNDTIKKVFAWINIFSNLEFTISQKRNDVVAILETKMKEHYYGIKIWISDMMLGNKNLLIGINRFNVNFSLGQKTWTENIALNNVKDEPRLWNMFNSILNNNKLLQLNENNTIADFIRAVNLEAKKIHSEFELKDANFATTKTNLLKDNAQIEFQMILGNEMRLKTIRLNVKEVWKVEGNINRYFERSHYHNWDDIDTYQHLLEIVTSDMKSIYSQLAVSYEDNNIKLQQFVASGRHNINFVVKLNEKLLIKTLTILIPNKQTNKIWEKVDTELEKISKTPLYAGSLITDFINKVNIELQTNLSKDLSIVVHYKPNAKIISDFSPMELKVNFGNAVKEKIINFTNLINEANFAELMNNFFTNALDLNLTTKNSLADVISILGNKLQTNVNYINQIKLLANEEYHIVNPISNEEIAKLQPENRLLNEQQDIFTVTDKLVKYNESLSSIKILNYGYLVKLKNIINYEKIEEFVNNISQSDALLFTSDDTKAIAVNKIQSNLQSKIHSQMTLKLTNAGEATTKLKAFTNNDLEFSLNFGINKFIFKVTINKVNVGTNDIDEVEDFFNQEYDLDVSPTSNINDILAKINYQLEQKIANLKVININSDDGNRRFKYLRDELEVILVNNPTKIFKLRLKNIKYNLKCKIKKDTYIKNKLC